MSLPTMKVHLRADYGKRCILRDVQFELRAGEALGMVGTSGAGKTTLVMALLGLLPFRGGTATGEVLLDGVNLLTMTAGEARRLRGRRINFPAVPLRRSMARARVLRSPRPGDTHFTIDG
jgi:ABC-type glutathione transport system ATPase component